MLTDFAESGLGSFPFRVIAGTHRCFGTRWLLQRRRRGSVDQVSVGTSFFDIRVSALLDSSINFHPLNYFVWFKWPFIPELDRMARVFVIGQSRLHLFRFARPQLWQPNSLQDHRGATDLHLRLVPKSRFAMCYLLVNDYYSDSVIRWLFPRPSPSPGRVGSQLVPGCIRVRQCVQFHFDFGTGHLVQGTWDQLGSRFSRQCCF